MKPYYQDELATIYHGDCRDILPQLPGDVIVTDPPYGISLENHAAGKERRAASYGIAGDDDDRIGHFITGFAHLKMLPIVIFASPWAPWYGEWRNLLVWDKGPAVGGGGDTATCFKRTWELIQTARTPALQVPRGESVLRYWIGPQDSVLHVAQKPLVLMSYLITALTLPGQVIIDPCAGSGSTLEAAKKLRHKVVGVELEERHCETAAKRLQQEVLNFQTMSTPHVSGRDPVDTVSGDAS